MNPDIIEPTTIVDANPVLAVMDVGETIRHYTEVLGFGNSWTWGTPPVHGGVTFGKAGYQFTLDPEIAAHADGHTFWHNVRNLDALYDQHVNAGARIYHAIQTRPWGMREYAVKDNNGYILRFAESGVDRESAQPFPATVRIEERLPIWEEMEPLIRAVGWDQFVNFEVMQKTIATNVYGVVAIDNTTNTVVGCALLGGDGMTFFYVRDVMVHPDYQKKRVGTTLMKRLTDWADANAPDRALIGLYTGRNLHDFYEQFGFQGPANGLYGMTRHVQRNREAMD